MTIRSMKSSDIDTLVAIESKVTDFPWTKKNFTDSMKPQHKGWVFLDEKGEIDAFILIQKVVDETHLLNICVKAGAQGKGIGKQILGFVIDYANSIASTLIVLEVRSSNQRAQALYYQAGFNEMAVRKNYYPTKEGREDAILMGLDLSFSFKE